MFFPFLSGPLPRRDGRKKEAAKVVAAAGFPDFPNGDTAGERGGNLVMDVYPFHHRNLLFNIFTEDDLTFKEVREILDQLLDAKAFGEWKEEACAQLYDIQIENIQYAVDVLRYEVIIYRRIELAPKTP